MKLNNRINTYQLIHKRLKEDKAFAEKSKMPGGAYFISDGEVLSLPREDGDNRYPLGKNGFNYWVYASGYMHSNEGLFSHYLRASEGQEPKIAFFAGFKEEKGYDVVPLLSVPVIKSKEKVERYTVFTMDSAYYITQYKGMSFAVRVFVDESRKTYWSLFAENTGEEEVSFYVSSYFNPFLKNAVMEGAENRWFRQGTVIPKVEGQTLNNFLIEVYEERNRGSMMPNYAIFNRGLETSLGAKLIKVEETVSRNDYVGGTRSSLHTPEALYEGSFGETKKVATFTEVAIAGDMLHFKMQPSSTVRVDTRMTCTLEEEEKDLMLTSTLLPKDIDDQEEELITQDHKQQEGLKVHFGKALRGHIKEDVFTAFFEQLKKQVEFCSVIKGYIQLSNFSLIGIRDVYQALEGLVSWEPEVARAKILEGLSFMNEEGRMPRQYSLPAFEGAEPAMDLRAFIDQGTWVISTLITYLKYTGEFDLLKENCGYYEFVDEKAHRAVKADKESTVLQHMFEMMDYLLKNRDHDYTKCVCALYGDWNDALDGLGVSKNKDREYGTGVSVMATLQVYQNCAEMIELLSVLDPNKYKEKIQEYEKAQKEIEEGLIKYAVVKNEKGMEKIIHGWGDERSYLVGSFKDPDGLERDGVTANAFWVLSGLYSKNTAIKNTILEAYKRLDSKYGLKTFNPHFEKGTPGVGRIGNLPKGTAENGAVYVHATTFGIMSLFKMGETEKAWDQLEKVLPFTHTMTSVSPYVVPNSYGYNEEKKIDGESMQDWQTGSSNVILKTLVKYIFGIEPEYEGVWIQPSRSIPFETMDVDILLRGCKLKVRYSNQNREKREFKVNGIPREGVAHETMELARLWLDYKELKERETILVEIWD